MAAEPQAAQSYVGDYAELLREASTSGAPLPTLAATLPFSPACDQQCHFAGAAAALPCSIFAQLPCTVLADSGCPQCAGCCDRSQCLSIAWPLPPPPPPPMSTRASRYIDPDVCKPGVCTRNILEKCYYDPICEAVATLLRNQTPGQHGWGCNAGNKVGCRFCGFGRFRDVPCPTAEEVRGEQATFPADTAEPAPLDVTRLEEGSLAQELQHVGVRGINRGSDTEATAPSPPPPPPLPWSPPTAPPPSPATTLSGPCLLTSSGGEACATSPGYPDPYPTNTDCKIRNIPTASRLRVDDTFEVEGHAACAYDYLLVNGERYCGSTGPHGVVASQGTVTWHSDSSRAGAGWRLCWDVPSA